MTMDTISDFGEQWQEYTENRGYYGSQDALKSLLEPLLTLSELEGASIADVGAGTGRYSIMFHRANAGKVIAIEPSGAFPILKGNVATCPQVFCVRKRADEMDSTLIRELESEGFDFVFCIGVLQFIPNPRKALKAMGRSLKKGGRIFVWVYAVENNRLYLSLALPLRRLTTRLSHNALKIVTSILLPCAEMYAALGKRFQRLPMADYLSNYFLKVDRYTRQVIIHDQLNPGYVKYYKEEELRTLFESCGFKDIRMHHRMGYSWSVTATY